MTNVLRISVFLVFVRLFPSSSYATAYYVNDATFAGDTWCTAAGNNANSGMVVNLPKATIQDVFDDYDLAPGDIIYVDKGNYTQLTTINVATDCGDATGYVSVVGAGRYVTIITAPATSHIFDIAGIAYIKISNLKMVSTQAAYNNVSFTGAGDHGVVDNCVMTSNGTCINVSGTSHYCAIQNCNLISTGGATYSGIYHANCDNVTYWKDTIAAVDYGIKLDDPSLDQPNVIRIKECVITVTPGAVADAAALWLHHSDNDTIIRNKISGGSNGIYLAYDSDDAFVVNNYIYNTARGFVAIDQFSNSSIIRHNSFYTTGACLHFTPIDGLGAFIAYRVHNNIFYSTGNVAGDAIVHAAPSQCLAGGINYNLYYNPNGARIGMYISTYYSTLATWQAVDHNNPASNKGDENSLTTNPNYSSPATGALEITSSKQTGTNAYLVSIPKDIYGTTRVLPVIGAWEDAFVLLPVEMLYFKGACTDRKISLSWATAVEENSSHFLLERSVNGLDFEIISTIPAAGRSNTPSSYSFLDAEDEPSSETLYYRLTQVDMDGTTYHRGLISVRSCNHTSRISTAIFPNPAGGVVNAVITSSMNAEVTLAVLDMQGRVVLDQVFRLEKGTQSFPISLQGVSPGSYSMQFIVNGEPRSSESFIKK